MTKPWMFVSRTKSSHSPPEKKVADFLGVLAYKNRPPFSPVESSQHEVWGLHWDVRDGWGGGGLGLVVARESSGTRGGLCCFILGPWRGGGWMISITGMFLRICTRES